MHPKPLLLCANIHTHTYQEYLYRFVALASGGWATGPWQRGRSRSKGKTSLISLAVVGVCFCVLCNMFTARYDDGIIAVIHTHTYACPHTHMHTTRTSAVAVHKQSTRCKDISHSIIVSFYLTYLMYSNSMRE